MEFIGRKNELKRLREAYATDDYEGVLVYGRRHIGKSELIKQSLKEEKCPVVYYEYTKVSVAERRSVPYGAPRSYNPNYLLITSEWFGFTFYIKDLE